MSDEQKKGIENFLIGLGFSIDIANDVIASLADGKITLTDGARFLDDLFKFPALIKAAPEIVGEAIDIDDKENAEIKAFIQARLSLPNANIQPVIDASVDVVFAAGELATKIMALVEAIKHIKDEK